MDKKLTYYNDVINKRKLQDLMYQTLLGSGIWALARKLHFVLCYFCFFGAVSTRRALKKWRSAPSLTPSPLRRTRVKDLSDWRTSGLGLGLGL